MLVYNEHNTNTAKLRLDDRLVGLEHARGDLHRPRLQTERRLRVPGLQFQFQQHPYVIGQFQRLVQHVLALHVPFGYGEDVVECHLLRDRVRGADDVGQGVLDFVGGRYLFPRGEEHSLVQLAVLREQDVDGDQAREVEHVYVILDCYL